MTRLFVVLHLAYEGPWNTPSLHLNLISSLQWQFQFSNRVPWCALQSGYPQGPRTLCRAPHSVQISTNRWICHGGWPGLAWCVESIIVIIIVNIPDHASVCVVAAEIQMYHASRGTRPSDRTDLSRVALFPIVCVRDLLTCHRCSCQVRSMGGW